MTSGLAPVTDLAPATWVQAAMPDFGGPLCGSILPGGFEAYARILHPAKTRDGWIPWRDVAAWSGAPLEPLSQWEEICRPDLPSHERPFHVEPWEGSLGPARRAVLTALLAPATTTPDDVWFCFWYGYGAFHAGSISAVFASTDPNASAPAPPTPAIDADTLPTLRLPHREYYVFRGPIDRVDEAGVDISWSTFEHDDGPNLWWPTDRAWFVASEIDLVSTYVGGNAELVRTIVASPDLEAFEVAADGPYA